jgi:hypothetical protein
VHALDKKVFEEPVNRLLLAKGEAGRRSAVVFIMGVVHLIVVHGGGRISVLDTIPL